MSESPGDSAVKTGSLKASLQAMGRVAVCFSGGVDSSFLLAYAASILGADRVLAIIGDSETLARSERDEALGLADSLGIRTCVIQTRELEDAHFTQNPEDRCFYCKDELFRQALALARSEGFNHVLDGTNADDLAGHRPGRRAAELHSIRSPLAEAGLTKRQIRDLSRLMHLPTWDKPAMACLASRFPHGRTITPEGLRRVEEAEAFIRSLGFLNVRVRDHGDLARIEVDADRIPDLTRFSIASRLKQLGFRYVTVDLEGFRSGSLNPVSTADAGNESQP